MDSNAGHTVWKGKYWYIIHNTYPYSGDSDHLMAIPCGHKTYSHELSSDEVLELADIYAFMRDYYGERQYFSCTRESMANRSIEHLHMHFLPGKLQ
jgi:diadenosine tetraphosphate (Ap4A) HIT family hydrolase